MSEITNKYERTIDGVTYDVVETMTPKAPPTLEPLYPNAKRWERVKIDDKYYYIDSNGNIILAIDNYSAFDNQRYASGNHYPTRKLAEHARDTQTLMNQIQRWRDLNDPIVLGEKNCCFYFYFYNYTSKKIQVENWFLWQTPNVTYFSSRDLINKCLTATEDGYTQTYGERLKALFEVE